MTLIYKICPESLWREAERQGVFAGAPVDLADGYIHFSTAEQVAETTEKHFTGQSDLLLVAVEDASLGEALRYEPSRGGALFPHLYGPLPLSAVRQVAPLPLGPDGRHVFPGEPQFDPPQAGWTPVPRDDGMVALVGPFWTKTEGEGAIYGFLAEKRHLNRQGAVHGGMIMTFADNSLGMASWAANGGRGQVTIQLDTQFIDAVKEGDFVIARCNVVRQTRSLMFMAATLTVGPRTVATASGVWKLRAP
jgi:uncharacterized protein (TIGR00369 family)